MQSIGLHPHFIQTWQVTITASDAVHIVPNHIHDGHSHDSLAGLSMTVAAQGHSGGLQLILVNTPAEPGEGPRLYLQHEGFPRLCHL